ANPTRRIAVFTYICQQSRCRWPVVTKYSVTRCRSASWKAISRPKLRVRVGDSACASWRWRRTCGSWASLMGGSRSLEPRRRISEGTSHGSDARPTGTGQHASISETIGLTETIGTAFVAAAGVPSDHLLARLVAPGFTTGALPGWRSAPRTGRGASGARG